MTELPDFRAVWSCGNEA